MSQTNSTYEPASHHRARMSRHAGRRVQQRGICPDAIPLLKAYGEREHDGQGAIRYLMTRRSVEVLRRVLGAIPRLDDLCGIYAVISADDGTVITVGHRI